MVVPQRRQAQAVREALEELVFVMTADAYTLQDVERSERYEKALEAAQIALASDTEEEGDWQLVPKEPTRAMVAQGSWASNGKSEVGSTGAYNAYRTMLAAAPDGGKWAAALASEPAEGWREALEPFARFADFFDHFDDAGSDNIVEYSMGDRVLRIKDFRRARAMLESEDASSPR